MEILHQVVAARPLDESKIRVTFENGATGVFDCSPYMEDNYWKDLRMPHFFRQVKAEYGTLCWPNDIDIDPEEIWEDTVFDAPAAFSLTDSGQFPHFAAEPDTVCNASPAHN